MSVSLTASVSALTRPSPAAPDGTNTSPGFTQNWPTPSVMEPASPVPIASARSAAAASVITTGFSEPSSPWKGIGTGRAAAASKRARPPRIEPVKPAAATCGCLISSMPASKPWTRPRTPAGMSCAAAADRSTAATSSDRPGWSGCDLTTTGQPAPSALAVSPCGDREGEGEVGRRVDGDDAEGHLVAAQVRDRRGRGGVGVVDDDVEEGALVDDVGEGSQLVAGAGEFPGQPDRAERGLRVGGLDELVLGRLEPVGGGPQEGRADRAVGQGPARVVRGADSGVHLLGCGLHRNLFPLLPGSGVDTPDWCCCHRGSLHTCNAAVLGHSPGSFDMLNAVFDGEYAVGDYFPSNEGVKGDVGWRDGGRSAGQVRGADG